MSGTMLEALLLVYGGLKRDERKLTTQMETTVGMRQRHVIKSTWSDGHNRHTRLHSTIRVLFVRRAPLRRKSRQIGSSVMYFKHQEARCDTEPMSMVRRTGEAGTGSLLWLGGLLRNAKLSDLSMDIYYDKFQP